MYKTDCIYYRKVDSTCRQSNNIDIEQSFDDKSNMIDIFNCIAYCPVDCKRYIKKKGVLFIMGCKKKGGIKKK